MRKIILILTVILGFAVAGGLGLWYARASGGSRSPFRTEEAKREDLLASFSATGTLEPEDIIDVGTQVAGQIKEFGTDDKTSKAIDYGSDVDAGAVLAKIDDSLYVAKRNQSKAMVDVAKAAYAQALAKVDDAKANVKVQQAQLDSDQVNYDHSKRDWDRAQILSGKQALAPADYDTYQSAYDTSKVKLGQDKAALAQADVQVKEFQAAADNANANIAAAQAQLNQDEINLGYTIIKAPVKGVIIDRRVTLGQTVQSSFNTPSLFLLARDLKRMKVWASVNEADIGNVHVGQTVTFTCDAYPGEKFTGTVGLVRLNATMTNNVVTYTVEVLTDNPTDAKHPNGKLLPYLTANLKFEVDKRENALTVSNEALRWKPDLKQVAPDARAAYQKAQSKQHAGSDGQDKEADQPTTGGAANKGVVWVQDGQFVQPVKVKLGLSDGARTEITGGNLKEGDAMVSGDALMVADDGGGSNPFAPQMFGGKKQQ
jgi:HlyD family secretion protein